MEFFLKKDVHIFLKRFLRFGLVGGIATTLHISIEIFVYNSFHPSTTTANGIAFLFANLFSFVVNAMWSFSSQINIFLAIKFATVSIFGLITSLIIAKVSEIIGLSNLEGTLMVVIFLPVVTFLLHNFWTFKRDKID